MAMRLSDFLNNIDVVLLTVDNSKLFIKAYYKVTPPKVRLVTPEVFEKVYGIHSFENHTRELTIPQALDKIQPEISNVSMKIYFKEHLVVEGYTVSGIEFCGKGRIILIYNSEPIYTILSDRSSEFRIKFLWYIKTFLWKLPKES